MSMSPPKAIETLLNGNNYTNPTEQASRVIQDGLDYSRKIANSDEISTENEPLRSGQSESETTMKGDYFAGETLKDGYILRSRNENGTIDVDVENERVIPFRTFYHKPQCVPPLNFALVEDKIYRSGFPMPINYPFLKQLKLKTIIYLGDLGHDSKKKKDKKNKDKSEKSEKKKDKHGTAEIMAQYQDWLTTTDIKFHNLLMEASQEPFNRPDEHQQAQESLTIALSLMLDKQNFPMLIHSNKGKHRTGVLVGLMRKLLQGWSMSGIFEEYEQFAMGKSEFDLEFIELWQPELWVDDGCKPDFVRI